MKMQDSLFKTSKNFKGDSSALNRVQGPALLSVTSYVIKQSTYLGSEFWVLSSGFVLSLSLFLSNAHEL